MAVASYLCSDVFGFVLGKRNYKARKVVVNCSACQLTQCICMTKGADVKETVMHETYYVQHCEW